jgi:hypothetical protein
MQIPSGTTAAAEGYRGTGVASERADSYCSQSGPADHRHESQLGGSQRCLPLGAAGRSSLSCDGRTDAPGHPQSSGHAAGHESAQGRADFHNFLNRSTILCWFPHDHLSTAYYASTFILFTRSTVPGMHSVYLAREVDERLCKRLSPMLDRIQRHPLLFTLYCEPDNTCHFSSHSS